MPSPVPYLTQAWLDRQRDLTADLPERPGATARVQYVVTGTPDGEVRYVQSVVDGHIDASTIGGDDDVDVTLTQTFADAREMATGELDPSAAFMQGRVKVVGDMAKVMALMPLTRSAELRAATAKLDAETSY